MKFGWIFLVVAALALAAAGNAEAARKKPRPRCVDQPRSAGWVLLPGSYNYVPAANGCSPAVYGFGRYLGQDPDPFIRQQLLRDPSTSYTPQQN